MAADVVFYPGAIEKLVHDPNGAIGRELLAKALKVESIATRLCPVDTGRLRGSITHEPGVDSDGIFFDVGSNVDYAAAVELGHGDVPPNPYLRAALAGVQGGAE